MVYEEKEVLKGIDLDNSNKERLPLLYRPLKENQRLQKLIAFWDVTAGLITIGDKSVKENLHRPTERFNFLCIAGQPSALMIRCVIISVWANRRQAIPEVEQIAKASGCHEFMNLGTWI